ncbi:early nodulin-like protein 1 [Cinnamomum micranthum f. kanehirae]|uniref:Early nodulin-like protein 1 n=1 Tax=Cinnamomum micranthum f. kanehirae TaxID=337451 RepID=A0A3S3N6R3_9MAGN|nr:early nodulin-like protein 1 [Cinnamomum micranthum f. kanehirae]
MAQATLTPNHHSIKAFHGLGLLVLLLLMQRAGATQFKVGGSSGWTVPTDPTAYNQWAQKNRFRIGDSLLFVYPPGKDSVLHVKKDDYYNCNTKSFLDSYNDGKHFFHVQPIGAHYFISGNEEKLPKK